MEIILKEDIENLGNKNDIVVVKDGYARNFLIPKGMAIIANASSKKVREENLRQRAHKEEKILAEAQTVADKLGAMTIKIGAKAGENGKIFGSVNTIQIADALAKAGYEIDRKNISIAEDSIKQLGEYEAQVKLHRDLVQAVKFEVVEE